MFNFLMKSAKNLYQIPRVWLPSQPPALSLLSVFGILSAPNSTRLVAFQTPRAFFAFRFWDFIRPKFPSVSRLPNSPRFLCFPLLVFHPPQIPPVGCLPNPRALFEFRFWGFYPPQIPLGWLPSQLPVLSFLSSFEVLSAPNSPFFCLPNHSR